jgi:peptidoglycan L-alanyl-D-glutamate endopeptidase CwlK
MSRKIEDLTPECQIKYMNFMKKMADAVHHYTVTCVARLMIEHMAIWSQGRYDTDHTNALRKLAGLAPITEWENLKKKTWTLHSKHLVDPDDPKHGVTAFDIAMLDEKGKPTWDIKADIDDDNISDYEEAGRIGESCGLTWGGRFKDSKGRPTPDYCHFQDDEDYTKKRG